MLHMQRTAVSERRRGQPMRGQAKVFLGSALLSLLLVAGVSPYLVPLSENFHAVIPGCVYRSGQLCSESLQQHALHDGIRSVINLRGPNPGQPWYDQEWAVARQRELEFYDLPVDSQCPTPLELGQLLQVLEHCSKPVLIHCQSGIDRSGMVAAICILLLDETGSLEQARRQLGWRYGHLPWRENMGVQEGFLQDYSNWLAEHQQTHERSHFHDWLLLFAEQGEARTAPAP